jgi:hypothetical protein
VGELNKQTPGYGGVVSAAGIEPATNGLKGQQFEAVSPIQKPTAFAQYTERYINPVSWMHVKVGQHFYFQWRSLPTDGMTIIHEGGYTQIIPLN